MGRGLRWGNGSSSRPSSMACLGSWNLKERIKNLSRAQDGTKTAFAAISALNGE